MPLKSNLTFIFLSLEEGKKNKLCCPELLIGVYVLAI